MIGLRPGEVNLSGGEFVKPLVWGGMALCHEYSTSSLRDPGEKNASDEWLPAGQFWKLCRGAQGMGLAVIAERTEATVGVLGATQGGPEFHHGLIEITWTIGIEQFGSGPLYEMAGRALPGISPQC